MKYIVKIFENEEQLFIPVMAALTSLKTDMLSHVLNRTVGRVYLWLKLWSNGNLFEHLSRSMRINFAIKR